MLTDQLTLQRVLASLAFLMAPALAADLPLGVENSTSYPDFKRIWYGDGRAYVGPTVPAGVKTAFNFTSPWDRDSLITIRPDADSGAAPLPDPTFLAIHHEPDAGEPLFFVHSAAGLAPADLYLWAAYSRFVFPVLAAGGAAAGGVYLVPVDGTPDTFTVNWFTDPALARSRGLEVLTLVRELS